MLHCGHSEKISVYGEPSANVAFGHKRCIDASSSPVYNSSVCVRVALSESRAVSLSDKACCECKQKFQSSSASSETLYFMSFVATAGAAGAAAAATTTPAKDYVVVDDDEKEGDQSKKKQKTEQPKHEEHEEHEEHEHEEHEEHEVGEIVDERKGADGKSEFLVHWKEFDELHRTWEPEKNLAKARAMIHAFRAEKDKKKTAEPASGQSSRRPSRRSLRTAASSSSSAAEGSRSSSPTHSGGAAAGTPFSSPLLSVRTDDQLMALCRPCFGGSDDATTAAKIMEMFNTVCHRDSSILCTMLQEYVPSLYRLECGRIIVLAKALVDAEIAKAKPKGQ